MHAMETTTTDSNVAPKWEICLDKVNLNEIHKQRKCNVILVVEKTCFDLEKLLMIRYHSETDVQNELKFISLNDIYDFIISYEIKKLFVHEPVKAMLRRCCQEARQYLKKGSTLPHQLLAQIIKLRIITIITNDVHSHKYIKVKEQKCPHEKSDQLERRSRKKHNNKTVIFRQIYIILIQFYSPKIIPACYQCGLSINAIMEFGQKEEKLQRILLDNTPSRQSDIFRQEFWRKAPYLYYQHHLDQPFRLVYNPRSFAVSKDNPRIYYKQCKRLYRRFLKSVDIEKIRVLKDALVHRFGLNELLQAEMAKDNDYDEVDEKKNSTDSLLSISSGTGWEDSKPFVKRVYPELDLDSRKRYTKWPLGRF